MSEALVRTHGGPHAGTRYFPEFAWPLPMYLRDEGGEYMKISESQLTDEQAAKLTHVVRGAQYEWTPGMTHLDFNDTSWLDKGRLVQPGGPFGLPTIPK